MDVTEAKSRLVEERSRLEAIHNAAHRLTVSAHEAVERESASNEQHAAGQATEAIGEEIDNSVLAHVSLELEDIEYALKRLENGTYGSCEICNQPIGEERLAVMPAARYCIADQNKLKKHS